MNATQEQIAKARELYCDDENVQVDDNAEVSECDDGVWVQAWVFVPVSGD